MRALLAAAAALVWASTPVAAQSLIERVRAAPDGLVRMEFEARDGVCGGGDGVRWASRERSCPCACEEGPVRVEILAARP